jgi:hypothetical protein
MTEADAAQTGSDKVGFRDIYRAVGESETRIKEHISLVLLPIASSLADHEMRIRSIEEKGSGEAQEAMSKALVLAAEHEALTKRVDKHDDRFNSQESASLERRRIGGISAKAIGITVVVANAVLGALVIVSNLMTSHQPS